MPTSSPTSSDVRQWARQKGMEVGERGRLSPEVLAAYSKAHGGVTISSGARKKATARKAPARKAPARKAPAKAAVTKAPTTTPAPTPVIAVDSERVEALEAKVAGLAARLERLEAARAAQPAKRGLFGRKG